MAKITVVVEVSELVIVGGFGLFLLATRAQSWDPSSYGRKALEFCRKLFKGFMRWLVGVEKTEVSEANPDGGKTIQDGVVRKKSGEESKGPSKKSGTNIKTARPNDLS